MKKPTKSVLLLAALLAAAPAAYALDADDQGEYVVLNPETGRPTPTQQRYFLRGSQWMMDGKIGDQDWQPVCRASGDCRLEAVSGRQLEALRHALPEDARHLALSCIRNRAFAFCRNTHPADDKRRLYWWVVERDGLLALPLNRVK